MPPIKVTSEAQAVAKNAIPTFHVLIHPAEDVGGYWAECTFPNGGCTTQGETVQETEKNMFESITLFLEDYPEITNYFLSFEVCDA
ncbi:MAG: type II toxin-antitoxin system HicB family antitoxin [Clostridiales bacterium]|jgi:predicted RNase H-like HicB family nuclease|nr:type II toxin-antitoxin system HicB family antitoxin [Clostridiales bacterium]